MYQPSTTFGFVLATAPEKPEAFSYSKQPWEQCSSNYLSQFTPHVTRLVERLSVHAATVGIVLLGGLGRRSYVDDYSDLDLAIFVDTDDAWYLPPFSFHLALEGKNVEFNVTQQNIKREEYPWDEAKRSAYQNGIIVFDRDGALRRLLNKTLRVDDAVYEKALITSLNQMYWKGVYHAQSAAARGYPETAHFLINEAVDLAVKSVFALNRTDRPHKKWQLSELSALAISPTRFRSQLGELLVISAITTDDAARRSALIQELIVELSSLAKATFPSFPADVYLRWAQFFSGRQISSRNPVDLLTALIATECSAQELKAARGALSWAITKGPATIRDILQYVREDNLIPPRVIAMLERLLEGEHDTSISDPIVPWTTAKGTI